MLRVVTVEPKSDYRLFLQFNNGEKRLFDMRPYLQYPVFVSLNNQHIFNLAKVDYGTVTWPGDLDIAPETLYGRSVPITNDNGIHSSQPENV